MNNILKLFFFSNIDGSSESGSSSNTTTTTRTEKIQIDDGGILRSQIRTTTRHVTRTRTAAQTTETFEEYEVES